MLRRHDPRSRLHPQTFAFVTSAFREHGRAEEVVPFFEEQLAAVRRAQRSRGGGAIPFSLGGRI